MESTSSRIKKQILDLVAQAAGVKIDASQLAVVVPPSSDLGDLTVSCFYLSKLLRRSPNQIADDLAQKMSPAGIIRSIQNVGPYLNFFLSSEILAKEVLQEIKRTKSGTKKSREKVMIEYSQPNTHKEFHIGHLRNAVLGNALVNLFRSQGFKVIAANYLGDIGSHVAKCLWALEKFHKKEKLPENKGRFLGQVYAEAAKKIGANQAFKKQADEVLRKLEAGDKKWISWWQKTRKWSLAEFDKIYKTLDIKFDQFFFESEMEKPGKRIVADLLKKGLAKKSEGAVVIDLEKYQLKNFLLLKSDGSSLYSTKDLALARLKFDKFRIDRNIVLTDTRQNFYFQQLFKTLDLMGFKQPMTHVSYEFVTLKQGAMASRIGNVVLFEDFFQEVLARAKAETGKRHKEWSKRKTDFVAKNIALAAIKFDLLKVGNSSVIVFDPDEALSFDGFSGPYLLYTLSRINSVFKKSRYQSAGRPDYRKLNTGIEKEILLQLAEFPEVLVKAREEFEPSEVAKYLFELSRLFANFYQTVPILSSAKESRKARLALLSAVQKVMVSGLEILGIKTLKEM